MVEAFVDVFEKTLSSPFVSQGMIHDLCVAAVFFYIDSLSSIQWTRETFFFSKYKVAQE